MMGSSTPSLSFILITIDNFESLRRTVAHVAAQNLAQQIELILCAPSRDSLELDAEAVRPFHSVQIVETGQIAVSGPTRARAARAASAPVIVYGEDHCYPDPGWAEALLEAHQEPHAAVGPAMRNANPESVVSWADLLLEYGMWIAPGRGGQVPLLQGHNTSYKRDLLVSFGPRLDVLLEAETVLFWELRRQGHTLFFETRATAAHVNFSRWSIWLPMLWNLARAFSGTRVLEWSIPRRAAFALASPLIPAVRLARLMRSAVENRLSPRVMLKVFPALLVGLVVDGAGQTAGCVFGVGDSAAKVTALEFHREQVNAA
jgi:hypothetical protein